MFGRHMLSMRLKALITDDLNVGYNVLCVSKQFYISVCRENFRSTLFRLFGMHALLKELRVNELDDFKNYLRMCTSSFDELLHRFVK